MSRVHWLSWIAGGKLEASLNLASRQCVVDGQLSRCSYSRMPLARDNGRNCIQHSTSLHVSPVLISPVLISPVLISPVLISPVLISPVLISPVLISPDVTDSQPILSTRGQHRWGVGVGIAGLARETGQI